MKKCILGIALVFSSYCSHASTEADISSTFRNYWANFSCGKYGQAAQMISPSDLKETREQVLPIMLTVNDSKKPENKRIAATFFGAARNKKPNELDTVDVYTGINKLLGVDERTRKILCSTKINKIKVTLKNPSNAVIAYSVILDSGEVIEGDPEVLANESGRWYLKMSTPPAETARSLKEIFKVE